MLDARAQKLAARLPQGFEAALIGTEVNRFYLLDFDAGDAGTLLLLPDRLVYIIDARYIEIAQKQVTNAQVVLQEEVFSQLAELLAAEKVQKLYLEDAVPIAYWSTLQEKIPNVEYDISNTLSNALNALRQVKDEGEMQRMRKAQQITDACFTHMLTFIQKDMREVDIALEIEHYMRSHGADGIAFETIAVTGANTSLPHGVPGETRVQTGDFITLDFGAKYQGYCADMTRTIAFGEPGEEKRKVYDTVLKAHLAGIAAAKGGLLGSAVDKVARDIIDQAGYAGRFGHGLGHALGIEVHEDPRFSARSTDVVPVGAVMSVEPGIYIPGQFGCRIEDAVYITETGCEPLPQSPKNLIIL